MIAVIFNWNGNHSVERKTGNKAQKLYQTVRVVGLINTIDCYFVRLLLWLEV